ncbi:hypothetical protein ACRRTK_004588 [Alexandromys fortis]
MFSFIRRYVLSTGCKDESHARRANSRITETSFSNPYRALHNPRIPSGGRARARGAGGAAEPRARALESIPPSSPPTLHHLAPVALAGRALQASPPLPDERPLDPSAVGATRARPGARSDRGKPEEDGPAGESRRASQRRPYAPGAGGVAVT